MSVRTRENPDTVKILDLLIEAVEDFDKRLKALEKR